MKKNFQEKINAIADANGGHVATGRNAQCTGKAQRTQHRQARHAR